MDPNPYRRCHPEKKLSLPYQTFPDMNNLLIRAAIVTRQNVLAFLLSACMILLTGEMCFGQKDQLPNIVIIFADDLGYGDLGCYGAERYQTPHLDRLAEAGMRFTSFYASEAVCSASRASLLTGCYSERVGIQGALTPGSHVGLNPEEVTIAEMLKEKKYRTAIFGKWHLGLDKKFLPLQQGFDEYFGLAYSNDMWPVGYDGKPAKDAKGGYPTLMLYEGNKPVRAVETLEDQALLTTLYTERAVQFIDKNHKKPFFLYLAHSMVHVPLGVSEKYSGSTEHGIFGDVMEEVDWSVGRIMETLEKYGLTDQTLVIFTSDNGPWLSMGNHAGSAGPLREGKGTAFEGGVRVPCIISWPGVVESNRVSQDLVTTMDIFPTLADITGASLPPHPIDGKNFFPQLTGQRTGMWPRDEFWYYYNGELRALRSGNWKLIFPHYSISYEGTEPGRDGFPGKYAYFNTGLELYDLENDIGERNNLADTYPEIVKAMAARADNARSELGDQLTGVKGNGIRPPGRIYAAKTITVKHAALGKQVMLDVAPNPKYAGKGPKTLTDGDRGSMDFHDGKWLGFWGQDFEVTIDMGGPSKSKKISCAFLENQGSWIFLPGEVVFYGSENGKDFEQLNLFREELQNRSTASVKQYETLIKSDQYRYFKIKVKNAGPCPEWHPGNGGDSWVFIDEVIVN